MSAKLKGIDKIRAGRVHLLLGAVFYGTIVMHLEIVEDTHGVLAQNLPPGMEPSMATDGKRLIFHPDFVEKLTKEEMKFVLAHETLHIVLLTHLRLGNKDPKLWNMATDYAINILLKDEGFTLLPGVLVDEKFREWPAEKIYIYLQKNPDEVPGEGSYSSAGEVMQGGSIGEDGQETQPMDASKMKVEEHNVRAQIKAAAIQAKKAGNISAGLARLIDEICAPRANWREILQRFLREQAFNDWSFARSHTRMLHTYGTINPVIESETVGDLALIVDTSGSVDEKQLAQFAGEISDILENFECKVTVVYCDTEVNRIDEFEQHDLPLRLKAVGGGGTKGRPAYEWVEKQIEEKTAIIHYTDSYLFDWKEIECPEVPTLVACTESHIDRDVPEWAELVDIS